MDLEMFLAGGAFLMSVNIGFLNTISYFETKINARSRFPWKEEEFQTKCEEYWKETPLRKDLEGTTKMVGEILQKILFRPGAYLACKSLSREGYREPKDSNLY